MQNFGSSVQRLGFLTPAELPVSMASSRFEYFRLGRWPNCGKAWHPCSLHLDNLIARNLLDDRVQNFIMPLPWLKTTNPPLILWQKTTLIPGIYVIDSPNSFFFAPDNLQQLMLERQAPTHLFFKTAKQKGLSQR